jgi:glycosyltransferase involved in cell wall biosynthesis
MGKKKIMLSVVLAVYNEEENLGRCLASVKDIADEVIIVDGGSTDRTVEIAKKYGAVVISTTNPPIFHINKQKALDAAHGEWILQLDADEAISKPLSKEIMDTISSGFVPNGYFIARHNYFLGNWLRKGGQYPDYVIRLFRRGAGKFPQKSVHEQIEIDGHVGHLDNAMEHYSYTSISQYWNKACAYIKLSASEIQKKPNNKSLVTALSYMVVKPLVTFFSIFVRHKGFVDGWRGFLYAFFSALHFPKAYWLSITGK